MEHIGFHYQVAAHLTFTAQEIRELISIGKKHYDYKCQEACRPGVDGFIYAMTHYIENDAEVTKHFTFRQIDLMRKILEMSDPKKTPAASGLFMPLKGVLDMLNEEYARLNL